MFWQKAMCMDATAHAEELLGAFRTLRRSKILHSHKSEYKFLHLPDAILKLLFCPYLQCTRQDSGRVKKISFYNSKNSKTLKKTVRMEGRNEVTIARLSKGGPC